MTVLQAEIFSDIVCPWCYIGHERLKKAATLRPDIALQRSWHPFQLNPDMPFEGMDRGAYMTWKFGTQGRAERLTEALMATAKRDGIDLRLNQVKRVPSTLRAHRLVSYAGRQGLATAMMEALFTAYFTECVDIGDIDILAERAEAVGLGRRETALYLESEEDAAWVAEHDIRARRSGIDGVPCFVFGRRYAVVGAEEPESFLPLFDAAVVAQQAAE